MQITAMFPVFLSQREFKSYSWGGEEDVVMREVTLDIDEVDAVEFPMVLSVHGEHDGDVFAQAQYRKHGDVFYRRTGINLPAFNRVLSAGGLQFGPLQAYERSQVSKLVEYIVENDRPRLPMWVLTALTGRNVLRRSGEAEYGLRRTLMWDYSEANEKELLEAERAYVGEFSKIVFFEGEAWSPCPEPVIAVDCVGNPGTMKVFAGPIVEFADTDQSDKLGHGWKAFAVGDADKAMNEAISARERFIPYIKAAKKADAIGSAPFFPPQSLNITVHDRSAFSADPATSLCEGEQYTYPSDGNISGYGVAPARVEWKTLEERIEPALIPWREMREAESKAKAAEVMATLKANTEKLRAEAKAREEAQKAEAKAREEARKAEARAGRLALRVAAKARRDAQRAELKIIRESAQARDEVIRSPKVRPVRPANLNTFRRTPLSDLMGDNIGWFMDSSEYTAVENLDPFDPISGLARRVSHEDRPMSHRFSRGSLSLSSVHRPVLEAMTGERTYAYSDVAAAVLDIMDGFDHEEAAQDHGVEVSEINDFVRTMRSKGNTVVKEFRENFAPEFPSRATSGRNSMGMNP